MKDLQEFKQNIKHCVMQYIGMPELFDDNPMLRINPATLDVVAINGNDAMSEIEDSDEAIENAAIAQGAATESYSDFQVTQNPDLYPIKKLVRLDSEGRPTPDGAAIDWLAKRY